MKAIPKITVTAGWLFSNLTNKNLIILDASIKPITREQGQITGGCLPNAFFFDLKNDMSDANSPYSHTLLPGPVFVERLRQLGLDNESLVVVYDNQGIYSSPRAWYMIRNIGHENVFILDGGLPAWLNKGYPIANSFSKPKQEGNLTQRAHLNYFCTADRVIKALDNENERIIDARSAGRFYGREPEPRPGLKPGQVPGSYNLPFEEVLNDGKFRPLDELKKQFEKLAQEDEVLIFSCGSGITSCITAMAAELCGYSNIHIYDGSWTEWADENNNYPVVNIPGKA